MSFLWPLLGSATGTSFFHFVGSPLCCVLRNVLTLAQTRPKRELLFFLSLSLSFEAVISSFLSERSHFEFIPILSDSITFIISPTTATLRFSGDSHSDHTGNHTCKEQALSFAQQSLSSKADLAVSSACCELGELFTLSLPLEKENCGVALRLHQRVHSS